MPLFKTCPAPDSPRCLSHVSLTLQGLQPSDACSRRLSLTLAYPIGPPLYIFRDSITQPAFSLHFCFRHPFSKIASQFSYGPDDQSLFHWESLLSSPTGVQRRFQGSSFPIPTSPSFPRHEQALILPVFTLSKKALYETFTFVTSHPYSFSALKLVLNLQPTHVMKSLPIFVVSSIYLMSVSYQCQANEISQKLSQDDEVILKLILNEDVFYKDYGIYLENTNSSQISFVDFEIHHFKKQKRTGKILTTLGFIFYTTSIAGTAIGIASVAGVDECNRDDANSDKDEDDDFNPNFCGIGYLFAAGSFVVSGVTGIPGTIFLISGVKKIRMSNSILPRLHRLKTIQNYHFEFQSLSFIGSDTQKFIGVTFSF